MLNCIHRDLTKFQMKNVKNWTMLQMIRENKGEWSSTPHEKQNYRTDFDFILVKIEKKDSFKNVLLARYLSSNIDQWFEPWPLELLATLPARVDERCKSEVDLFMHKHMQQRINNPLKNSKLCPETNFVPLFKFFSALRVI